MKVERSKLYMSKPELGALLSFTGNDPTRNSINCLQLTTGIVFATDGKRALKCEVRGLNLEKRIDAVGLRRVHRYMLKTDEAVLSFAKTRAVAMVQKNVFPLWYIDGKPHSIREVFPKGSKFGEFAADPNLLVALCGVCKAVAPGLQPMFKLEHVEAPTGPFRFSFPYNSDWQAVVMGCRA